jgi:hypothetical protein
MKTLLISLAVAVSAAASAGEPASFHSGIAAQPPAHPPLYSFVDVYRLTVAGPIAGLAPLESAPGAPIRVAAPQTPEPQAQGLEPRFSIAAATQPDKWLLLLAGLALAGWVAHRRLAYAL